MDIKYIKTCVPMNLFGFAFACFGLGVAITLSFPINIIFGILNLSFAYMNISLFREKYGRMISYFEKNKIEKV